MALEWAEHFGDKGGWRVELTTLPLTYAVCLEIWEPQPSGILRASSGIAVFLYSSETDLPTNCEYSYCGKNIHHTLKKCIFFKKLFLSYFCCNLF